MFNGTNLSTVGNYVRWGVLVLNKVLADIPEASMVPTNEYLVSLGNLAGEIYGEVMKGCCIVTDGSLHCLEKDEAAQWSYGKFDKDHPDYNGWKS
jgi:hypothetical protein